MQVAPLTLATRVFSPRAVDTNASVFVNPGQYPTGDRRVVLALSPPSAKRHTARIDFSLDLPVLSTAVGSESVVASRALVKGYFVIPDTLNATQRGDVLALTRALLADTAMNEYVVNLQPFWG